MGSGGSDRFLYFLTASGLPKTLGKRLAARLLYGGSEARWRRDTGHTATLSAWWPAFKLEIKKLLRRAWDAAGTN